MAQIGSVVAENSKAGQSMRIPLPAITAIPLALWWAFTIHLGAGAKVLLKPSIIAWHQA